MGYLSELRPYKGGMHPPLALHYVTHVVGASAFATYRTMSRQRYSISCSKGAGWDTPEGPRPDALFFPLQRLGPGSSAGTLAKTRSGLNPITLDYRYRWKLKTFPRCSRRIEKGASFTYKTPPTHHQRSHSPLRERWDVLDANTSARRIPGST